MTHQTLARKSIAALFLGFVCLFFIRLLLSFIVDFNEQPDEPLESRSRIPILNLASISYEKAVSNNLRQLQANFEAPPSPMEQAIAAQLEVYAKEATINTYTPEFEQERKRVMEIVDDFEMKVRIEKSEGLKPNRNLRLILKVPEEKFDEAVEALKGIGILDNFIVTKEDKSEEAKQLIAQRKSLESYKASLMALRSQTGKVEEFIKLEEKIQEVERQVQNLGVQLGDYVQDVSFSNVSFALVERISFFVDSEEYPLAARVVDAFVWTVMWYFVALVVLAFFGLCYASIRTLRTKSEI